MAYTYLTPQKVLLGEGALALAKDTWRQFGNKALIVTDAVMVKLKNVEKVTCLLDEAGIAYEIYDGINQEPCDYMIEEGAGIYLKKQCEFLIAVGGGSPIDSMKAIGAVVALGDTINSFMGKTIEGAFPPMCAVPTTAGTGSEATQFTIINNTEQNIKMLLKGPALLPELAVIDPVFTMTAPPSVTAATGIDALCHAVEAYTSVKAFSMTDTMAKSAVKRIFDSLYRCYADGSNMEARIDMAIAALEAGMAFNNSSVTIIHGMSRPIGALYHVPHGLSNAMLLEKCLDFAVEGCPERFRQLGETIGVCSKEMTDMEGTAAFIKAVSELCRSLKIQTPEEFGIHKDDFFEKIDKMAQDALDSGSPGNTRRKPEKEDIVRIYQSLFE